MLYTILTEFRRRGTALSLETLSENLGVEPSALEGMLRTLERTGWLVRIDGSKNACPSCPLQQICDPATTCEAGYVLARRQ